MGLHTNGVRLGDGFGVRFMGKWVELIKEMEDL